MADRFEQMVSIAGGTYNARTEIQDCFGKLVIFVDVSVRPRRLNGIRILSRNTALLLQNHARGCSGINKAMLLLLLGPRLFTEVVEILARELAKAAANPWYMFPLMTIYLFLSAGDSPRFLASAVEKARKGSSKTFNRWAVTIFLTYSSCKLIGSDRVLEIFKKLLANKRY